MPDKSLEIPAMTLEKLADSIAGMNIHKRIKERREALGLSMQELAARIGVRAWQTVQQWEKEDAEGGTAPKRERLELVARVLDTTPGWLLFGQVADSSQNSAGQTARQLDTERIGAALNSDDDIEIEAIDPGAYLHQVADALMAPRYLPGDYAIVEPAADIEIEDDVLVKFKDGRIALMRLLSRRGGMRFGVWSDPTVMTVDAEDLEWMSYVGGFVPARKVKRKKSS